MADKNKSSKDILKRAGITRAEYKKRLSNLKKQGVVSKKVDARSHIPTKYMLGKMRRYSDVAAGAAHAVKASKIREDVAAKYLEKGIARKQDKFLIVPKTSEKQKAKISRGHIEISNRLKRGEEKILLLPYRAKDFGEMITLMEDNASSINALKYGDEQFGFQLFGNNSKIGYPDAEHMVTQMRENYRHILHSNKYSRMVMQDMNFVLIRFKNSLGNPTMEPYKGEKISHIRKRGKNESLSDWERQHFNKYKAGAKARQRARESYEQREKRLDRERIRAQKARENETPAQKKKRLEREREYYRTKQKRLQKYDGYTGD